MSPWDGPRNWYIIGLVLAIFLTGAVLRQHDVSHRPSAPEASASKVTTGRRIAAYLVDSEGFYAARTLRFDVCNGFANQRIAIAYGVVMAHHLGRAAVLPDILMNGTQGSDDWTLGSPNSTLPLSIMYDSQVSNQINCTCKLVISPAGCMQPVRIATLNCIAELRLQHWIRCNISANPPSSWT